VSRKKGRKKEISARERLLTAALRLFAERGQRASVEEIARQACVAKGTVYYHFGSKRRLLQQALEAELEQLAPSSSSSADPTGQLRATIEGLAQWAISRPERLRALLLAGQPGSGLTAEVGHQLRDRALRLLQQALALAQAAKLITHPAPPELIAVALFGALVHIVEYWQRQGRPINPRQLSTAFLSFILRR
jgi:AcrR family transcriptional regulator